MEQERVIRFFNKSSIRIELAHRIRSFLLDFVLRDQKKPEAYSLWSCQSSHAHVLFLFPNIHMLIRFQNVLLLSFKMQVILENMLLMAIYTAP